MHDNLLDREQVNNVVNGEYRIQMFLLLRHNYQWQSSICSPQVHSYLSSNIYQFIHEASEYQFP